MHNAGQSHRTDLVINCFFCTGTSKKTILKNFHAEVDQEIHSPLITPNPRP